MESQKSKPNSKMIVWIIVGVIAAAAIIFAAVKFMPQKSSENDQPSSSISGYYSSSQRYNGGSAKTNKNINVSEAKVQNNADGAKVQLKFKLGSKASGVDETNIGSVPEFSVYCLENPYRMVVKISSVTFWDYEDSFEGINSEGIAIDMFRPYTSTLNEGDSQDIYLFFQMKNDLAFKVSENSDSIEIDVKKAGEQSGEKAWYVISSLYYDWEKMIDQVELNPTSTNDFTKQVLISKPFASQEDAKSFADSIAPVLQQLNLSEALAIKEMAKGELPLYDDNSDDSVFINNPVISVGGNERTLPLLMSYGQYLCSTPDGKTMLFAKDISFEVENDVKFYVELWTTEISGKATKLNIGEFAAIDKAAFSPDGKKLALLNNTSNYSLEVYDYDTNEIINLGEEGIGNMVANFSWDEHSNLMHVVAGDNGVFQMKTYDFSKPYGSRITVLSETPLDQNAGFKYSGGQLYYDIQTITEQGYDGTIYRIGNGQSTQVAKGISFEISPDGKYIAVKDITDTSSFSSLEDMEFGEGAKVYGLKLVELATGKEIRIAENADIGNFVWAVDSSKLYYAENKQIDSPDEKYYYELHSFQPSDGKNETVAGMKTDYFVCTKETNTLLVSDFVGANYATYLMDINNINK